MYSEHKYLEYSVYVLSIYYSLQLCKNRDDYIFS